MRLTMARSVMLLICIISAVLEILGDVGLEFPALDSDHDDMGFSGFVRGQPEDQQAHVYRNSTSGVPHTAAGKGLHEATVGVPASFTIQLVGGDGKNLSRGGVLHEGLLARRRLERFIYVWIANEDQIMIAEVKDSGNIDGILTATFTCDFPGTYLVYVEEVEVGHDHEGSPIEGSPFSLSVTGSAPAMDVDSLPVCDSKEDTADGVRDTFWRPGTWLSSRVASAVHGVTRDGWVFQPKTCVFDTFSHEDLKLLAGLKEETTWLMVMGGSVQRGVFLSLVDMALARGQKANIKTSAVQKCWGYADVSIGNLRLTYQDMRLFRMGSMEDTVVCNDDKLVTGSTSAFVRSAQMFLNSTVFQDGNLWPSVILTPSNVVDSEKDPNLAIRVLVEALPPAWRGKLFFVDHMSGLGYNWSQENPTRTELRDVGMSYHGKPSTEDGGLGIMQAFQGGNNRISFMSAFPMYQPKLFENERSRPGMRNYGGSQHYHYVSKKEWPESLNGERMVQSSITEMLAHIVIGKAVGTKAALHDKMTRAKQYGHQWSTGMEPTIQVCHDCPQMLLPFHVKPVPKPDCTTGESLPGDAMMGQAWDGELCPGWCMKEPPVSQTPTQSGTVDVRQCIVDNGRDNTTTGVTTSDSP